MSSTRAVQALKSSGNKRKRLNSVTSAMAGNDTQRLNYKTLGSTVTTNELGERAVPRYYIPGYSVGLAFSSGAKIASFYSTGKFLPGTRARWVPSVGFTQPGRVYVGFTDNPEVIQAIAGFIGTAAYSEAVKGLGNVITFPIYQDHEFMVPSRLRRKMFDTNISSPFGVDTLDRSCQTAMFALVEGAPLNISVGSFHFTDSLLVEGLQPVIT